MAVKLASLLVTFIINVVTGVVVLLLMIVVISGYSESDATWGLGVYIVLALVVSVLMSVGAWLLARLLVNKQFGPVVSALTAIPVFSIVGVVLETLSSIIGIGVAEFVRVHY